MIAYLLNWLFPKFKEPLGRARATKLMLEKK